MQKQPNIRWRKRDSELLRQEINRFNSRLYYQEKKNPDANWLPERANFSKAVESIETRTDFNRLISSLRRFTADTAKKVPREGQTATTKWAEKEHKKERRRKEREYKRKEEERNEQRLKRAEEIGKKEVKQGGIGTGVTRAEMGRIIENAVKPTHRDVSKLTDKQLEDALKLIDKQIGPQNLRKKNELFQHNYIKGMIKEGYSPDIIELVKEIDPDDFAIIADTDEYAKLKFVYPVGDNHFGQMAIVRNTWLHYASEKRKAWLDGYFEQYPELKETIDQESIDAFIHGTRDQIVTDDNVLDLMEAYEEVRIAFNVNVKAIRDEVIKESQGR